MNSLTPYWFVPLVFVLPYAILTKRCNLSGVAGLSCILFLVLYGELFFPRFDSIIPSRPRVIIMTYNLLGTNHQWDAIRRTLEKSNADIISLQELNPEIAARIHSELVDAYPYQVLASQDSVISRYPLTLTTTTLPGSWGSPPQIYHIEIRGQINTLINAHFYASVLNFDYPFMNWVWRAREQQAATVTDFVAQVETPVIMTADLNATDQSYVYSIMTHHLRDAWREGGWGLGYTFPGGVSPGMWRPIVMGRPWPMWLARIDYIFHSDGWQVRKADFGEWDGVSDHRPVIAYLEQR